MTRLEGNCTGVNSDIFYEVHEWGKAAGYCVNCPIKLQCREEFITDPWAYAGGMTPSQRNEWRIERRQPKKRTEAPKRPVISDDTKADMVAMWDAQLVGPAAIAREFGVAKSTVQRVLRAAGRKRTPEELETLMRRGAALGPRSDGEVTRSMVRKLYEENYSPKEIAKMVGVSLSHVYAIHTGRYEEKRDKYKKEKKR